MIESGGRIEVERVAKPSSPYGRHRPSNGPPPLAKEPMNSWPEFWSAEDYASITPLFDGAELVPAFSVMQGCCPLCFFTGQNY